MGNTMNSSIIVENKKRKFGADKEYIYCEVDGLPVLFTAHQIKLARLRALKNPEDLPKISFWRSLFERYKR